MVILIRWGQTASRRQSLAAAGRSTERMDVDNASHVWTRPNLLSLGSMNEFNTPQRDMACARSNIRSEYRASSNRPDNRRHI